MQFICVFETDQAEEKAREVVELFCDSLPKEQEKRSIMVRRISIVSEYFIEFAVRRNRRALENPDYYGSGRSLSLTIGCINDHAIEVKIVEEGGFERIARKSHLLTHADLISFDLVNGGLMMRAILKWRTC